MCKEKIFFCSCLVVLRLDFIFRFASLRGVSVQYRANPLKDTCICMLLGPELLFRGCWLKPPSRWPARLSWYWRWKGDLHLESARLGWHHSWAAAGQPEEALNCSGEAGITGGVLLMMVLPWSALWSMGIFHSWPLAWLTGLLLERCLRLA